jgi:poly(glycerol-phosphate) alpha-glucosyltransferase
MKAALLTYSISRADGGIFEVTRRTAQSLLEQPGMNVEVLGLEDSFTRDDLAQWHPIRPKTFRHRGPRLCGYVPGLRRALDDANADVLHVHGIWSYYTLAGHNWSKQTMRPYVLTVHGMLSSFALQVARWKKLLVQRFFKDTVLRSARCLQAFTHRELDDIRRFGLDNPVCVIPNGVDLPQRAPSGPPPWHGRIEPGRKVLLYLGRLHPIKGLPNLIQAWSLFRRKGGSSAKQWSLAIAGWDQDGHEAALRKQVESAGLSDSVHFLGPQFGADKEAAYHLANAFVLPSRSEGLPSVVLEAWANRLPVLMTPECSLPEGIQSGAALPIATAPERTAEALAELAAMSDAERASIGQRGRHLVEKQFTWSRVAVELRSVYAWMVEGGAPPACVALA